VKLETIQVSISITRDEYLRVYKGTAKTVFAYCKDGKSIQFPVKILQQFVEECGVYGDFIIHVDAKNKFQSIEKVK